MTHDEWLIVLRPDGVIVDVSGGAPRAWVGRTFDALENVRTSVMAAANRLVEHAHDPVHETWLERAHVAAESTDAPGIWLLLVEAVPLRRARTSLQDLLMRTTEMLMAQAKGAQVNLHLDVDERLPVTLDIDAEKVSWGVATLVGNALRHATATSKANRTVHVQAKYADDGWIVVSVRDNGPGIAQERLRWLLERDPVTQRMAGLALVVLNDVVAAHGGRMQVVSSTDAVTHGTTVRLFFPATRAQAPGDQRRK